MKKIISFLLVLILLLCSCGPKTIEEGHERLESGDFRRVGNEEDGWTYSYEVYFGATCSFVSWDEAVESARTATSSFYKDINKTFGDFDIVIVFMFYTQSGTFICGAIDGELIV